MILTLIAALAVQSSSACPAVATPLPAELAGWSRVGPRLEPGQAFETNTIDPAAPSPIKQMPAPQRRPGRFLTFMFTVKTAGPHRIALDQPGWIDVRPVSGPTPLTSIGNGHGPTCSTIRKLVAFDLKAQAYYLDLTGLARPRVRVMLVPGR